MKRYLIVGNGIAGAMAALRIREKDKEGEIHLFTEEAYPLYYRVRFPELIAGEVTIEEITIHSREFYQARNILLHLEEPVIEIDLDKREARSRSGKTYPFDLLLWRQGEMPSCLPFKGWRREGFSHSER
jgi:nitrite reductase (NADH) large subunit